MDPSEEVRAAKVLVRREVLRQIIAPSRIIQARLMLYYREFQTAARPWVSAKNALQALATEDSIEIEDINGVHWYRLPRVQQARLDEARDKKVPVYEKWTEVLARGAGHAEVLWRRAFENEGWVIPSSPVLVTCPFPDDGEATHAEKHEIDVYANLAGTPITIACEVRSGPGEGWVSPEVVRPSERSRAQKNIRHHFRAMSSMGLTPMLAAPFVDPSFYLFQWNYEGLHAKYLYYVFHPSDADVAADVRNAFRLGHVWADESPPRNMIAFVRRVPAMLDKMWEVTRREEGQDEDSDFEPF